MFYKVVNKDIDTLRLFSACSDLLPERFVLEYVPNRKTIPAVEGTCLYVFSELKDAVDYCCGDETFEIWECEVENERECTVLALIYSVPKYWECFFADEWCGAVRSSPPKGAWECDSVTLLKRVM